MKVTAPLCKFYGWDPSVVDGLTRTELEAFVAYAEGHAAGDTDIDFYD